MKNFYSKQDLWSLFLMVAFPLHLWTLLLAFRDISWVAERTNFWDAIGVVSYGMIFAFLESLVVFLVALLLGILIPSRWGRDKRLAIVSMLFLVLSIWAMLTQLYALQVWGVPNALLQLLAGSAHPLRFIYLIALAFIVPTVVFPVLTIYRSEKTLAKVLDMIGSVSLLTMLYLFLDFMALIVVVVRNI